MSEKRFGKIHRKEFESRKGEFEKAVTRCGIALKVPREFREIAQECTPTHAEACKFESIDVEDVHHYEGVNVARDNGWNVLGCGVGRCTFKFKPQCVVKFARSARRPTTDRPNRVVGYGEFEGVTGEESNMYEVASYTLADPAVKKFLNPIVAHAPVGVQSGYKWIVQPLVKTSDKLGEKAYEVRDNIKAGLRAVNAECEDMHLGNIGLLMDKYPVLIDYGFSVRCKRVARPLLPERGGGLTRYMPDAKAYKAQMRKKIDDLAAGGTKHRGRHGLRRPKGIGGVLTQRRRILWAEAGALRRQAKALARTEEPALRERAKAMVEDARFLEQQAWGFQTKLMKDWQPKTGAELNRLLGLLNQTRKEAFLGLGAKSSPSFEEVNLDTVHETPPEEA